MALYKYRALNEQTNETVTGSLEADSAKEARRLLKAMGLLPVSVLDDSAESRVKVLDKTNKILNSGEYYVRKLTLKEKMLFVSELKVLFKAQVPILEAMNILSGGRAGTSIAKMAKGIYVQIKNGLSFRESMEAYKYLFDSAFVGLIAAGEESGEYVPIFSRLYQILEKEAAIWKKIRNAMIEPTIIVVVAILAICVYGSFVIPRLLGIGAEYSGNDLPSSVSGLLNFYMMLHDNWLLVLIFLFGMWYALSQAFSGKTLKKIRDSFLLAIPAVANFIRMKNLSHFIMVIGVAYDAGIPILRAVNMASATINNEVLAKKGIEIAKNIENKATLFEAFSAVNLIPEDYLNLVHTGEITGEVGKMLAQLVSIFDEQVNFAADAMVEFFKMLAMIFMLIVVVSLGICIAPIAIGGGVIML